MTLKERYATAMHAMQTGVEFLMQKEPDETNPKHLRVGINSALISNGAIVDLLKEKGLITEEEYIKKLVEFAERDVASYKKALEKYYSSIQLL